MNPIIITVITLTAIGLLVAAILFLVAKKFKVEEDARIDDVEALLPGANCGGCGCAGCRDFATKLVSLDEFGDAMCPVGGSETMSKIASLLGKTAAPQAPKVAVVRCNGTCESRPKTSNYEGYQSCKVKASLYSGDTDCRFGCLGCGDCTKVCKFDAIKMDPVTGLPVVEESKCTGCGACSKACPKGIIELRPKGPRGLKVVVRCNNKDKGAVARKACSAACIGCSKCVKVCPHEAVVVEDFLAYIDPTKCKLCTKCVEECPTGAIHKLNFPIKKNAAATPAAPVEAAPEETPAEKPVKKLLGEVRERLVKLVKPKEIPIQEAPVRQEPRSAASFKVTPKPEPKPEVEPEPKPEPKVEVKVEPKQEPVKVAEPVAEPVAAPAPEPVAEAPKPRTRKPRAPKVELVEEPVAEPAAEPVLEQVAEAAAEAPKPSPKKRAPRKPKAEPKPAEGGDRDEVIELDLFSGGVS